MELKSINPLTPNEVIEGNIQDKIHVLNQLNTVRSSYSEFLKVAHPTISFLSIYQLINKNDSLINADLFNKGLHLLQEQQSTLGIAIR